MKTAVLRTRAEAIGPQANARNQPFGSGHTLCYRLD